MPTMHKIVMKDEFDITDVQADFICKNCPEHDQIGGAYYVNAEVLEDLRKAIDPADENKLEHKALVKALEPIVKAEGLYEFYMGN